MISGWFFFAASTMTTIKNYLSLIKFSHTVFALPFALIGFMLAIKQSLLIHSSIFTFADFPISTFILMVFCMITARSAAMAFNRYLDRSFDAKNARTAVREIPAGIVSPNAALLFTIGCCLCFIASCFLINKMVFLLSPVALFVILFYSYTKRFTALCHLVLGLGLSLAPIGAYLVITAQFALLPILFSFIVLFWVSGFDIMYALQDEDFDKENKLNSIPVLFGKTKALRISELLHSLTGIIVITAGFYGGFHWLYWMGTIIFISMLIYQHSIVQPTNLSRINIAFMTANGIASIMFAFFVILDLFFY